MTTRSHSVLAFAVLLLLGAGCSSEPKKPEPAKFLVKLGMEIGPTSSRTIVVEKSGAVLDTFGKTETRGKLEAADLKALEELAQKVEWAKIPNEGFKTADGAPSPGGRKYRLEYPGATPPRVVESMDGAPEDAGFAKLRDTIELYANKVGK